MPTDQLTSTFAALADPTRRSILTRLSRGETSVTELAEPYRMSLPAVSKHLKVLEKAGLIERGRNAQWRPCRLRAEPLREVADWVDTYRRFWEESLDRLDDYLMELQGKTKPQRKGHTRASGASGGPGGHGQPAPGKPRRKRHDGRKGDEPA